jgi:hypothetical protein
MTYNPRQSQPNALGVYVDSIRQANDWSDDQVAERATSRGYKISGSTVQAMCTQHPPASVGRGAVIALAKGLGVPEDRVAAAAMESMGFRLPSADLTAAEAVQRDPSLDEPTRRALLAVLRSSAQTA